MVFHKKIVFFLLAVGFATPSIKAENPSKVPSQVLAALKTKVAHMREHFKEHRDEYLNTFVQVGIVIFLLYILIEKRRKHAAPKAPHAANPQPTTQPQESIADEPQGFTFDENHRLVSPRLYPDLNTPGCNTPYGDEAHRLYGS